VPLTFRVRRVSHTHPDRRAQFTRLGINRPTGNRTSSCVHASDAINLHFLVVSFQRCTCALTRFCGGVGDQLHRRAHLQRCFLHACISAPTSGACPGRACMPIQYLSKCHWSKRSFSLCPGASPVTHARFEEEGDHQPLVVADCTRRLCEHVHVRERVQ
jgi:hypothetical protein